MLGFNSRAKNVCIKGIEEVDIDFNSRFNAKKKKQFAKLYDKPLLYYSLKAFSESKVDEIIIVTSEADIDYVGKDIVKKYEFFKVKDIVSGGNERCCKIYYRGT